MRRKTAALALFAGLATIASTLRCLNRNLSQAGLLEAPGRKEDRTRTNSRASLEWRAIHPHTN